MKILRLTTNYSAYLAQFERRHASLAGLGFERQHAALMADRFGWADAWTHALAPLGVAAWEPVANFKLAQKSWAEEHGVAWDEKQWLLEVSAAQVKAFQPEVLLVDDYSSFPPEFVRQVREQTPSIRLVAYWCGSPLDDLDSVAAADVVLSNLPGLVDYLNRAGKKAVQFRHAFDARIAADLAGAAQARYDLTFAGSLVRRATYHLKRAEILDALAKTTDIQVFSSIDLPAPPEFEQDWLQRLLEPLLRRRSYVLESQGQRDATIVYERKRAIELMGPELAATVRPPVFGLEMYRTLHASRVTVNVHLDFFGESASNMRLYEATGAGCCLLTDWKYDLAEQFDLDREVVAFKTAAEAVDKARYLLEHPEAAERIAAAGRRRTLADHTFEKRAPELLQVFRKLM